MRSDSVGLFWEDVAKVKPPKKEKIKRTPPDRFWEECGYIPVGALEEAESYTYNFMNDMELYTAQKEGHRLVYDIEVYPNYALFGFKDIVTKKYLFLEITDETNHQFRNDKLEWILDNFTLITFNGYNYDIPISAVAVNPKYGVEDFWEATVLTIKDGMREKELCSHFKVARLKVDQIDIIQLTSQAPSLKKCSARLHATRLQDLPFLPGTYLTTDQIKVLRRYNINDLDNTELVYNSKIGEIQLREEMSKRFKVDLRSDSDAQMAEAIINAEVKRITGRKYIARSKVPPGTGFKYKVPHFIKYHTPLLNWVLEQVKASVFVVNDGEPAIIMPEELRQMVIKVAAGSYKFGIGGLHSQEENVGHVADEEYFLADTDATSYYPRLILNAGLTPANLGRDFIVVYNGIVMERVTAKQAGIIVTAECLKIVANGTFGKLNSPWSIVYAPDLMIQVTVTGQLSILMLVERFELAGIQVTSVNTDGIVVKCKRSMEQVFRGIVQQWEKETGFGTEEIRYKGTYSRDINNYIAEYEEPQKGEKFKLKGVYAKTSSKKNAVNEVCIQAIRSYMDTRKPIEESIRECKEVSMFTTMREVRGGAVKDNIYLGKVVRWYYATDSQGEIISAASGNKVARSDGSKPIMNLPDELPNDINYDWYITEANKMLKEIGYVREE